MERKQCTACSKITEIGEKLVWFCRYHKKNIVDIKICDVETKYQRPCCPICGDIIDCGQICICKGDNTWYEGRIDK